MKPFPSATCFHETDIKRSICIRCLLLLLLFPLFPCAFGFLFVAFSALGSSCIMTKRDSLLAGFTYPSSSMSMPRRHSRTHGYPSSTAAPSDSLNPSRSVTDSTESTAWPSLRHAGSSDQTSHYGYSTAATSTPIPAPADHQTPILQEVKKLTHFRWKWQRLVVNFMPITSPKFEHLKLTTPNQSFAALW